MGGGIKLRWGRIILALFILGAVSFWMWVKLGFDDGRRPPLPALTKAANAAAPAASTEPVILFGDLHVHTTYSVDAFGWNLPVLGGTGIRPVAEACDFARFCSAVDFFAITDHAESSVPRSWQTTIDDIQQCNATSDPANPDVTGFVGFEWTQLSEMDPAGYYGHRNVVFKSDKVEDLPTRPVASGVFPIPAIYPLISLAALTDLSNPRPYVDYATYLGEVRGLDLCPPGMPAELAPADCRDVAPTLNDLWARLDEWGKEVIAIPHGTSWGIHVPPGVEWATQVAEHSPKYQRLFEVYSGHGNSEDYRKWRGITVNDDGTYGCPAPSEGYLPCCWRAGELALERCGSDSDECKAQAEQARQAYADDMVRGHDTIEASAADWQDCGQCRDCFQPAFALRPGVGAQAALATSAFDESGNATQSRYGFVASSDNHRAKPGTGYTQTAEHTDMLAAPDEDGFEHVRTVAGIAINWEFERQASYWYTGGLVALHADGRDRDSIWDAMHRKSTYGTSGPRILLWFDLVNDPAAPVGMGQDAKLSEAPRFKVKAIGSQEMDPGCPQSTVDHVGAEFIENVCNGQCFNPSATRRDITRIEVIKVRPQMRPDEPLDELIEDTWKVIECPGGSVCEVEFTDESYAADARSAAYYVRAIEAPSMLVNGRPIGCDMTEDGHCENPQMCPPIAGNDCLAAAEERAWSSPIYIDPM